jgi:hypothetical protein
MAKTVWPPTHARDSRNAAEVARTRQVDGTHGTDTHSSRGEGERIRGKELAEFAECLMRMPA